MNKFEEVAVSTYINYWPQEMSYQLLIDSCRNEELEGIDGIEAGGIFIDYPRDFVADCIESLHRKLIASFIPK